MSQPKVAIIHDWLVGGGAERVVHELHEIYPDAPIYTSYCSPEWRKRLDNKVVTGYLQHWPFSVLRKYVGILRIFWFRGLDLREFDLIIVSSGNGEAKGVRVPKNIPYICYCHSPVHYYWRHYEDYKKRPGFLFGGLGLKLLAAPLRRWDYKIAQRPDLMIANSMHIKADIKKYYHRDSVVVYPPVNIKRFTNDQKQTRKGFVTVGRLVPAKHTELAVQACTKLALPLTVVGWGPELKRLQKIAGPTIHFDDNASDKAVNDYIKNAEAFVFASFDDFGITPVEALAAGTPVIAYKAGGALDYVVNGKTGLFFDAQNVGALMNTLEKFQTLTFNHKEIAKHAEQFSEATFQEKMRKYIKEATNAK